MNFPPLPAIRSEQYGPESVAYLSLLASELHDRLDNVAGGLHHRTVTDPDAVRELVAVRAEVLRELCGLLDAIITDARRNDAELERALLHAAMGGSVVIDTDGIHLR